MHGETLKEEQRLRANNKMLLRRILDARD